MVQYIFDKAASISSFYYNKRKTMEKRAGRMCTMQSFNMSNKSTQLTLVMHMKNFAFSLK